MALILVFPALAWAGPLPYEDQINKLMAPLAYSGVPIMVKPDVDLTIDFGSKTWTLVNVHQYDAKGVVILAGGHYGLCAELATYLFEKIKPLVSPRYDLKFAMVGESGYFSGGRNNHIVLLMGDSQQKELYLIDPSFHKYGRLKDMADYHLLNVQDALSFVTNKSHNVAFSVDQATPLYIKNDFLLSFSVTSIDGKFDRDNFMFVISATERYKFAGRDILMVGRRNKQFEDYADKAMLNALLPPEDTRELFDKLKKWINQV
jgi:hypothetical protein